MEFGTIFNKNDYLILEVLIGNECSSPYKSISTTYIIEKCNYSHVKVRQVLKNFLISDFIKEGAKEGNKKTYYVTDKGISHYKTTMGYDDQDIDDLVSSYSEEKNIE